MSIYVPNYQHDIFVSYAHVDNVPFAGAEKGWVTTFISNLKNELGRQLGRADAYSLWMDYELRGNEAVTPDIDQQLNNTATLVLIWSRGYLASSWCQLEMNTFLSQPGSNGRVFVVEHDWLPRDEKPPELQDLLNYPFWLRDSDTGRIRTLGIPKPNPDREPEYYQIVNDLSRDLTDKLNQLRKEALAAEGGNDGSSLSARKKARLLTEKARLEAEMAGKLKEHESLNNSLGNPRLPAATQQRLTEKLNQVEADAEQLEAEIKRVDHELAKLNG